MQVRVWEECEERSDEPKRREYWISMYMPDTSKCNVAATKFFAISNATNAPNIAVAAIERIIQRASKKFDLALFEVLP